jgi:hypothetical protein
MKLLSWLQDSNLLATLDVAIVANEAVTEVALGRSPCRGDGNALNNLQFPFGDRLH